MPEYPAALWNPRAAQAGPAADDDVDGARDRVQASQPQTGQEQEEAQAPPQEVVEGTSRISSAARRGGVKTIMTSR